MIQLLHKHNKNVMAYFSKTFRKGITLEWLARPGRFRPENARQSFPNITLEITGRFLNKRFAPFHP